MALATSAAPLQSITAPTSKPFNRVMRPPSNTTSASGVFHCAPKCEVLEINFSASERKFFGRYGRTKTFPIFTGRDSATAWANSCVKPSFRNFPASSYSPQRVVIPLKPPMPPGAARESSMSVEQPERAAQTPAAIPAAPLPMTAMSTRALTSLAIASEVPWQTSQLRRR